jgi:hypothetical protein
VKEDFTTLRASICAIERTAQGLCNDPLGHRIEFYVNENGNVFIDTTDDEALESLLKSFEKEKESMHDTDKNTIQQILDKYKLNRAKHHN